MQFVEAVENNMEYLLKLSYLYVKDRQVAENIVQEVFVKLYEKHGDTIELHNTRSDIVQMTINRCKDYFRSWQYRKVQVLDLFGQQHEKAAPQIAEPEIIEEVLQLPLKYREVIVLYYYDGYAVNQVATLLSLPVATVKTRLQRGRSLLEGGFDYEQQLNQALGDWRSSATNVKAHIYAETIEGKKKRKRLPTYIKLASAVAVLTVGVTGAILMSSKPATAPVPAVENNTDPTELQDAAFLPINETFLKIEQYELFYRDSTMYTKEGAISWALNNGIEYYSLFNHLADYGLYWDKDQRDISRNSLVSALDYDLKDPHFATYFENMLAELSISKEQYIDDYLLVKREHEMLSSEMSHTGIGLTTDEWGYTGYDVGTAEDEFQQKMGLSFDYVEYLSISKDELLTPLDPQPTLSFNQDSEDNYSAKVTKNLAGEYIFVDTEPSSTNLPFAMYEYLYRLTYENKLPELSRFSFPQIKAFVEQEAAAGIEIAQQTLDYLTILERSIDWEFTVQPYEFNNIPTFEQEGLRVHNDLTLKIAEYELYHKDESIYERMVAYKFANELVADMYGLFNYLAQDHGYGWSAEIREQYYTSLAQELEASMQNELEKSYIENLLKEFNITRDDYIQYYLLPKKEYELLQQSMLKDWVGLDKNGRYYPGKQTSRYRETVGLTWQDLFTTIWSTNDSPMEKLDTQPDLPFSSRPGDPITVGLNENDEYVMEYPSYTIYYMTDEQKALFEEIRTKHNLPPLARYSVQAYLAQAQLLNTQISKELVEILTLFDRTVN